MRKRILSFIIAVILLVQSPATAVYAAGSLSANDIMATEENALHLSDDIESDSSTNEDDAGESVSENEILESDILENESTEKDISENNVSGNDVVDSGAESEEKETQIVSDDEELKTVSENVLSDLEGTGGVEITEANFPDEAFRNYLTAIYDSDSDGMFDPSTISYLDINNKNVASLKGIELFTELTSLCCDFNQLSELDVSKNTKLKYLYCSDNPLETLNLRGHVNEFETFSIPSSYDLIVYCDKDSWISSWCVQNNVPQMNVNPGEDGELLPVYISINKSELYMIAEDEFVLEVRELYPVSATNKTITWSSSDTDVAAVDENGKVTAVSAGTAVITASTVNNETATCKITVYDTLPLEYWYFPSEKFRNYLSENYDKDQDGYLSKDEQDAVKEIVLAEDGENSSILKGIEYFPNLEVLSCRSQGLYSLDISNNKKLKELDCTFNFISELDISQNTMLIDVNCNGNALTKLDVSNNLNLEVLYCSANQLTEIDVSKNTKLYEFYCTLNQLTEIDISKNTELLWFNCSNNSISELDISNNSKIEALYFDNTLISEIDLSNHDIDVLYCSNTKLKELDLSNQSLIALSCNGNAFTQLDLSNSRSLEQLECEEMLTHTDIFMWNSYKRLSYFMVDPTVSIYSYKGTEIEEICKELGVPFYSEKIEVTLNKQLLNMSPGDSVELIATITPENSNTTITWTSSDENVANVDENGKVTAVGKGTADITARTSMGTTATCKVCVYEYSISQEKITLDINGESSTTLTASDGINESIKAKWSSSDESIAKVSADGVVTALDVGEVTISAAIENGPVLECQVTVMASVQKLQIVPEEISLLVEESEQLHLVINPANATDKSVLWASSDENIVTVDQTGKIIAVSDGEATITATTSNQKKAECIVKVEKVLNGNDIVLPSDVIAVTNIHNTLDDIELPEGWKWENSNISLKYFTGENEKIFRAKYKQIGYQEIVKEIPVKILTVSKVNLNVPGIIEKDKETLINAEIVTNGLEVPEKMIQVEWISSAEDVISLTEDGVIANAIGNKAGSAQISAKITISDGTNEKVFTTSKKKVKVTAQQHASISFESLEGFTQNEDVYSHLFTKADEKLEVILKVTGTEKLTLKSSDAKVVSVSKVSKDAEGNLKATLTIKKPGYIKLTGLAGDDLATSKSIKLYIKDTTPNINTNTIELNNKNTKSALISICPNSGYEIENVSFDNTVENSDKFVIAREHDTDNYKISLADTIDKGTYKQKLKVIVEEKEYVLPITIKVISKEPSITVKQTGKVNLFYKNADGAGSLDIFSDENIKEVSLTDCDFTYSSEEKRILCTGNWNNPDKKGTLVITVDGYKEPVKKNIKISTEKRKPNITLSAKSATIYPLIGIETAQVKITDTTNGYVINPEEIDVSIKKIKGEEVTAYNIQKAQNAVSFTRTKDNFKTKITAEITINKEEYTAPVKLTYTINVNEKVPVLSLDKNTIVLNKAMPFYESSLVKICPKNADTEDISKITITAADAKSRIEKGRSIVISVQDKNILSVKLNDVSTLKTGTYKFNINAEYNGQKCQKAVLNVKVVDTVPSNTIKVTKKGSIDLLNRDTTSILYTPKKSNITGEIVDVSLSGRSANLFKAELEDGKIKVSVKGNSKEEQDKVALITKYNYGICLKLKLDNGFNTYEVTTNELKFKLTQSKPKVTVQPKQAVMFNTVDNRASVDFIGLNKDKTPVSIKKIVLTNLNDVFSYDVEQGEILLTDRSNVVKGKTYTLKFNIYFDGYGDNEKPVSVSYKVKIQ